MAGCKDIDDDIQGLKVVILSPWTSLPSLPPQLVQNFVTGLLRTLIQNHLFFINIWFVFNRIDSFERHKSWGLPVSIFVVSTCQAPIWRKIVHKDHKWVSEEFQVLINFQSNSLQFARLEAWEEIKARPVGEVDRTVQGEYLDEGEFPYYWPADRNC